MNNIRLGSYFTEFNAQKYLFYLICLFYVICTSIIVIIEPHLTLPCNEDSAKSSLEFENKLFHYSICDHVRQPKLGLLTRAECERGRHLLAAVFFGSLIGYERRSSDRPAGIRTMALVSLGSALFTINSTFGFLEGPMVSCCIQILLSFLCVHKLGTIRHIPSTYWIEILMMKLQSSSSHITHSH
jgi:hypothetical protein